MVSRGGGAPRTSQLIYDADVVVPAGRKITADVIDETTIDGGVIVAGLKVYAGDIKLNTLTELTPNLGIFIEDLIIIPQNVGSDAGAAAALIVSDDAEEYRGPGYDTMGLVKKIRIPDWVVAGSYYLTWEQKISNTGAGIGARGKIYKNGAAVGTLKTTPCDLAYHAVNDTVGDFAGGDSIELWLQGATYDSPTRNCAAYCRNFRVYGDVIPGGNPGVYALE